MPCVIFWQRLVIALVIVFILAGCSEVILSPGRSYRFIVTFDQETELPPILDELEAEGVQILDRLDIISGISCYLNEEQMELIQALPSVRYIEPDLELYMLEAEPPEPLFVRDHNMAPASENIDWGVRRISAPEAWEGATGKDVRVGVIDTGIATAHPDVRGAVVGGFNAVDGGSYEDDNNHGTYVASVLAARRNGVGIVGVAPDALLYAIKVLNSGGRGYISDVIEGCQWALKEGLPVVNMSLGSGYKSTAMREAMAIAASRGMSAIAAAGNEGERGIFFPARNDVAICVGASGMDDQRVSWSNYGPALKGNGVLAPGDWILAAGKDGGWRKVSGTSIAAPHVTGIIALLLEMKRAGGTGIPASERESLRRSVFESASQFENPDEFRGHGIVNAKKALDVMMHYAHP
jgi:subtilisin family serine protease